MTSLRNLMKAMLAAIAVIASSSALALPYTNFVVFGDSLSDPGNDYAITTANDPTKPFPPPPYFEGHFSNGITAAEYVAQQTGLPTQNFAQGGATTGLINIDDGRCIPLRDCSAPNNYQLQPGLLSGMQTQVTNYLSSGPANVSTTLFFLLGGGNDFFLSLALGDPSVVGAIVPNLFGEVSALIGAGAQHIALSNVPNIALTPFGQSLPAANRAALEFGLSQVNAGIAAIWAAFPDLVIPVDSFGLISAVVADPAAFGLTNATTPCIGLASCDGYAFFDDVHPTTALHAIAGYQIRVAAGLPEPSAVALMAIGLLGFSLRRRG